ncbi:phospholipid-binding protein [Pseudomonas sp. TTU2014-080ASC]|nr:phospholipid-binding protein [Pseudomonas sp. TTU2014-080ASC]
MTTKKNLPLVLGASVLSVVLTGPALAEGTPAVQPMMVAAETTLNKAEDVVTDTWITSKVKSTFLADSNLSGIDIKVETNKGVVSLSGVVATSAERDLAIAKAKEIKGVTAVSADALKTAD